MNRQKFRAVITLLSLLVFVSLSTAGPGICYRVCLPDSVPRTLQKAAAQSTLTAITDSIPKSVPGSTPVSSSGATLHIRDCDDSIRAGGRDEPLHSGASPDTVSIGPNSRNSMNGNAPDGAGTGSLSDPPPGRVYASLLFFGNRMSPSQNAWAGPNRSFDSLIVTSGTIDTSRDSHSKSPWLAVGLSAALPGLGQIYTHGYWKLPIIWGLGGYWVYEWVHLNNSYQDYRRQYSASISRLQPSGNGLLLELRDFYRDERDKFAWYLGALYMLNLVDAYVGASLYDFDVSPDLSAGGKIVPRVTASLHIGF
jgi:hypothetical protein